MSDPHQQLAEELDKVLINLLTKSFKEQAEQFSTDAILSAKLLDDSQSSILALFDKYALEQSISELKQVDPIASHKLSATVQDRVSNLQELQNGV